MSASWNVVWGNSLYQCIQSETFSKLHPFILSPQNSKVSSWWLTLILCYSTGQSSRMVSFKRSTSGLLRICYNVCSLSLFRIVTCFSRFDNGLHRRLPRAFRALKDTLCLQEAGRGWGHINEHLDVSLQLGCWLFWTVLHTAPLFIIPFHYCEPSRSSGGTNNSLHILILLFSS